MDAKRSVQISTLYLFLFIASAVATNDDRVVTVVEYLALLGEPDPPAQDYVRRLADFIWGRCLDNSQLREAGHRAAVPSVALWFCPEHIEALSEK